jgi:hypothetical protein
MMTSGRVFLAALAAFVIGVASLPGLASAQAQPAAQTQVQVPTPVLRPQKAPNPNAALPTPPADAATTTTAAKSGNGQAVVAAGPYTHGRVIILRGLYNIFSRGMDALAKDMTAIGLPVSTYNHSRWQQVSAKLIEEYRANPQQVAPVILIGHSLGGDASIVMSNWLAHNGVPVRLVVIFDAVAQTHPIVGGVQEVMNFYKPKGYGQEVDAAPSFKGVMNNIDLTSRKDVDHLNIDEDPVLHAEVTARVLEIFNETTKPAKKKSAPPVAKATTPASEPAAPPAEAAASTPPAAGTAPAAAAAPAPTPPPAATAEPAEAIPAEATLPAD